MFLEKTKLKDDSSNDADLVSDLRIILIVGVLGTGVPRLACLRPAAWLKGGPSTARLHQHKPKTLARGQASWGG